MERSARDLILKSISRSVSISRCCEYNNNTKTKKQDDEEENEDGDEREETRCPSGDPLASGGEAEGTHSGSGKKVETARLNTTKKVAHRFMITGVPSEERPSYTDIVLKVPFICLFSFFQLHTKSI